MLLFVIHHWFRRHGIPSAETACAFYERNSLVTPIGLHVFCKGGFIPLLILFHKGYIMGVDDKKDEPREMSPSVLRHGSRISAK